MNKLPWSPSFETGHPIIDSQHREILSCTNKIAGFKVDKFDDIPSACDHMLELLERHFAFEEELLAEIDFSGLEDHKLTHAQIRHSVKELVSGCGRECTRVMPVPCTGVWVDLVLEHMLKHDVLFQSAIRHSR